MKKVISVLLTMGMILSLAACSKETEETKKKKKKKKVTTETEMTESDASDSSETTEEDSSETSETAVPTDPDSSMMTHDLMPLKMNIDTSCRAYATMTQGFEDNVFLTVDCMCDRATVSASGYEALQSKLAEIYDAEENYCSEQFSSWGNALPDFVTSLTDEYIRSINTETLISSQTQISRADEKVLSFIIGETYYGFCDDPVSSYYYYTLDPQTGDPLNLYDIVTDRDLFAEAILTYTEEPGTYYNTDEYNQELAAASSRVKAGEDLPFLLNQNCITVILSDLSDQIETSSSPLTCTLSALELGDCMDLRYFNATADSYALMWDASGRFVWDFDEDGVIDSLYLSSENHEGENADILISMNDIPYEIAGDYKSSVFGVHGIAWACMVSVENEYYLYVETYTESSAEYTFIFHLEDGGFTYMGTMSSFKTYPYDPENVLVNTRSDLLGTGYKTQACTLVGGNGLPVPTSGFFQKYATASTTKDMTLSALDENYNITEEMLEIPEGTAVLLLGIDSDKHYAVFSTLDMLESEDRLFAIPVNEYDHIDFDVCYDDHGQFDLFEGFEFYD